MTKIFILSPNIDALLSEDQKSTLKSLGAIFIKGVEPLQEIAQLYEGDEPRILAVDPDFCGWLIPNDVLGKMPNLQAVCLQTTSFSWIDIEHASKQGIAVTNLRGFSSIAVAEWATMQTLALARRLPLLINDGWKADIEQHRGVELRGKTAGVIGLGRIGTAVAENLAGLGMKVQYWSRSSEDNRFQKLPLEELVSTSDVLVSAVAHNDETETLLSDTVVKTMKTTALLIDITHPIYNTELVLQLAAEGKIGGYAFEDEKNPFGYYAGNVWNGPALAWATHESMSKNAAMWVESIVLAAKGEFPNRIS